MLSGDAAGSDETRLSRSISSFIIFIKDINSWAASLPNLSFNTSLVYLLTFIITPFWLTV